MLFVVSKLGWTFAVPGNFLLLILLLGAGLLWTRWARIGRVLVLATAAAFALCAVGAVSDTVLRGLEDRFPTISTLPAHVDGIIVLAGETEAGLTAVRHQPALNEAAERATTFFALSRQFPAARLVYSGGASRPGTGNPLAAEQVQLLLNSLGLDLHRVVFESGSRNTYESAVALHRLLKPRPAETWVLITSAFHMPRSVGVFRRAGWTVLPYPVDYRVDPTKPLYQRLSFSRNLEDLELAVHEWLGLAAYRAAGRTSSLFPAP